MGRLGEPQLAKKALKNDAKNTSKKNMKKKGRECTLVYAEICTWEGGVPYKIPAGSGPRDWIIQAILQEARQNLMTTPLRATGARWWIS